MRHLLPVLLSTLLLSACGSGGEDLPLASASNDSMATLQGVTAVGSALAGASITLRCAGGREQFTQADSGGSYRFALSGMILPCVVRAEGSAAGTSYQLHSLVLAGSLRANITPLSDLLLARLGDEAAADFFAAYPADGRSGMLSTANVTGATPILLNYLTGLGVDVSALTEQPILTGAFNADPADAYDNVLESLKARLDFNGLTLATAADAVRSGTLPPPCSSATDFCWPFNTDGSGGYKLLTENRTNDKNEPEAKFHETDVGVTLSAIGNLSPAITSATDKSKSKNALPTRTLSITDTFRPGAGTNCSHAVPAGETCFTQLQGAITLLCGPNDEDDVLLALASVVAKDSESEVKKTYDSKKPNNPTAESLKGLSFDRIIACQVQSEAYVVGTDGSVTDAGIARGQIADNIGRSADKLTERKFWSFSVNGQTRYVGVQAGTVNGKRELLVLVSR
jgi:hypothetical protein